MARKDNQAMDVPVHNAKISQKPGSKETWLGLATLTGYVAVSYLRRGKGRSVSILFSSIEKEKLFPHHQ